jgi:leucyl-tRNA synthetase
MDLKEIAEKWQKKWQDNKTFEADPKEGQKKYFLTTPYPYVNAFPHIGHLLTYLRGEMMARFKRMQGYNVLWPQGWHATGSPIVNAAKRVAEGEQKQIKILKDQGFTDKDLEKFKEPKYWVDYFVPEFRKDFTLMGFSIDWRREFITTSLNPHYDRFIRWQFNTLKKKGYVGKGKHPVVWCSKCNSAVSDHSRVEGEGEAPQEFSLFRFRLDDGRYVVTATLRPDTCLGITNVYANPKETYAEIEVTPVNHKNAEEEPKKETWIVAKEILPKIEMQEYRFKETGTIDGKSLIGKKVKTIFDTMVPILPATFLDSNYGTGIVHSVPSESADDYIALKNLQDNAEDLKKYNLTEEQIEEIKAIEPILIFNNEEIGECGAEFFIDKYKITSQNQREKLDKIKKELYTLTLNKSTFNNLYKEGFSQDLTGILAKDGQKIIKDELLKQGKIFLFHELTGKVTCRCLTPSVVKIVSDQWFLFYGNEEWKKLAHKCVENMKLCPEKARAQFEYVVDWLNHWACTREEGLGTKLPWKKEWIIESLSDSTIYMAYYTIAHKVTAVNPDNLEDNFFDYVFLGEGSESNLKVEKSFADELREEFNYWYPLDYRNSGKDLIQNHLTFAIFNHVAIFPEKHWPQGFGVNGWVTVDGQKMSKSLGNMIALRDMAHEYSPDVSRITILSGGESLDDPNWDSELAKSQIHKLKSFHEFCTTYYNKGTDEKNRVDKWMISELHAIIKKTTVAMEETLYRTALQAVFFELQNKIKWYKKRCCDKFNKDTMNKVIEAQVKMLAPFAPHICEEIWAGIGKKDFISTTAWPEYDESLIEPSRDLGEKLIEQTISDIVQVKKLAKVDSPQKCTLFVSDIWKYNLFSFANEKLKEGVPKQDVLKNVLAEEQFKQYGQMISKFLPKMVFANQVPDTLSQDEEVAFLKDAKAFLESEAGCSIEIIRAQDSQKKKAQNALPGKPAILVQ